MFLRHWKAFFFGSGLLVIAALEAARWLADPYLTTWRGHLVMTALVTAVLLAYFGALSRVLSQMHAGLERRNRELLELYEATGAIYGELTLSEVLQRIIDRARGLLDARYGAISVVGEDGGITEFVVSGISPEVEERLEHPPRGRGLLGVVLNEGQRLRLPDIGADPRSVGFPANHPPMRSLLAVPVTCSGPFRGNLYLADKRHAHEFAVDDEETLERFAGAAAVAIDSVYLHERLEALAVTEERLRIAREMHDGMAQLVAYVNTKAQAVREYLRRGRQPEAERQLDELARAAREVYADIREGILALRTAVASERSFADTLSDFVDRWRVQSGIEARVEMTAAVTLSPAAELQLLRILQEALSNVRKHSGASRARVEVRRVEGLLVAEVADDGAGFDPADLARSSFPRFGLAIMRERVQSIGGRIEVRSQPGEGTRVVVEVPLAPEVLAGDGQLEERAS